VIQKHVFGDRVKIPLEIRLRGGCTYRFGDAEPAVKILVKDRKGLSALRRLDELRICEAYKESCDGDSHSPNFRGHLSSGCLVDAITAVRPMRRGGDPGSAPTAGLVAAPGQERLGLLPTLEHMGCDATCG
jgi:hypothetical protein